MIKKKSNCKKVTKVTRNIRETTIKRRKYFLKAYKDNPRHISKCCVKAGIHRKTFYEWLQKYPDFLQDYEAAKEASLDFTEDVVFKAVKNGDIKAAIFVLKHLGRSRGYVEHKEVSVDTTQNTDKMNEAFQNALDKRKVNLKVIDAEEVKKDV